MKEDQTEEISRLGVVEVFARRRVSQSTAKKEDHMMKKIPLPILLSVCVFFLRGVCALLIQSTASQALGASQVPSQTLAPFSPQQPLSQAPGLPAIRPHLRSPQGNGPTYTIEDVRSYVNSHLVPAELGSQGKATIVKAAFLQSQQVSALMQGESTGVPDGTLLCYVELHGTFAVHAPGQSAKVVTYHTAVEVFDAQTGNLLIIGAQ
jgi:hypothetical protein